MWRDELEAWLLATTTPLGVMFRDLSYTGHPPLWYICLRTLHLTGAGPWIMQAANAVFSAAGIYLFARYAPFSRLQKILFAFGYFTVFEYSVLSRDYALALLLLTALCVVAGGWRARPVLVAALTGAVCFANTHAMMVALPLGVFALAAHVWRVAEEDGAKQAWLKGAAAVGLLVLTIGFVSWMLKPPPDSVFGVGTSDQLIGKINAARASRPLFNAGTFLVNGFAPIPPWTLHFFNNSIFAQAPAAVWPVVALLGATLCLIPRRHALVMSVTMLGLLFFLLVLYRGYFRHHGFLFVTFWTSLWLAWPNLSPWSGRVMSALFTAVLAVQVVAGAKVTALHARAPFSQARNTAAYLRETGLATLPMAADIDFCGVAVGGYLNRRLYFPRRNQEGFYIRWDGAGRPLASAHGEKIARVRRHFTSQDRAILIWNRPLPADVIAANAITPLKGFPGAVLTDESFYLYSLPLVPAGGPPNAAK